MTMGGYMQNEDRSGPGTDDCSSCGHAARYHDQIPDGTHACVHCAWLASRDRESELREMLAKVGAERDALQAKLEQVQSDLDESESEHDSVMDYARAVKGDRDVHSPYEVLDLVPKLRHQLAEALAAKEAAEKEVAEVKRDRDYLQSSADLRWDADMRAIKRWQQAHPGNDLVWPDHADQGPAIR